MPPAGAALAAITEGEDAGTNVVMAAYAIGDRLKALDQMAKYGMGTTQDISIEDVRADVRGRLAKTLETARAMLRPADAEAYIAALQPIWS